jgi:hypothetical protein
MARAKTSGPLADEAFAALLDVSRLRVAEKLGRGPEVRARRRPPSSELVQLSVRVPEEVRRQVRDAAHRADTSVQQLVLDALRAHLRRVDDLGAPDRELAELADDYWELVRRGDYRRDVDALDDPDLAVQ